MIEYKQLIIERSLTIREVLKRLDKTGEGVLLLIEEEGRLLRTVTDGDIRRLLLTGCSLDDGLAHLPSLTSKTIGPDETDAAALVRMNELLIDQLPVVDRDGRLCGLYLRRDLDTRILLSTPHLGDYEMNFIEEAFRTNWIAPLGPNVDAFERELADYVGCKHAAAVSSGTAALHLALRILGVKQGDTVFCSSLTFVASANPILYLGGTPVFIDSDPQTWNLSVPALERAFLDAERTGRLPKAVLVVNLYGQSADFDPILDICRRYNVPVVEDAAESLGATYKDKFSGTLGRIGVYSFNGNKIITTSGGGMLVSDDGELVEQARFLSTQAREEAPWYQHEVVGYNYRMSNILAGIGRGQLRVLGDRVKARRNVFDRYVEGLNHLPAIRWMREAGYGRSTRWLTVCMLDPEHTSLTTSEFIADLARLGIEARHVWRPMHQQPLFAGCTYYPYHDEHSFSDEAFAMGICLPSGSNMTEDQQQRIIRAISDLFTDTQ